MDVGGVHWLESPEGCIVPDATGSGTKLLSHPMPAAIQRRAMRPNKPPMAGAIQRMAVGNARTATSCGTAMAPQRYTLSIALQRSASQAPRRLRDKTIPKGQGSVTQHTPQPLQAAPTGGLVGASG
ncbi:MAG: hypothetical protein A3F78_18155 [Burkholderiales bacterium RIFCSPLOWO2_12_FULL_61_40]|nr:MAG: hypothetical protein A3F78_18155 [Burkholderiales bacterium RIFCSPLOWO2_12_FULL_61_40]